MMQRGAANERNRAAVQLPLFQSGIRLRSANAAGCGGTDAALLGNVDIVTGSDVVDIADCGVQGLDLCYGRMLFPRDLCKCITLADTIHIASGPRRQLLLEPPLPPTAISISFRFSSFIFISSFAFQRFVFPQRFLPLSYFYTLLPAELAVIREYGCMKADSYFRASGVKRSAFSFGVPLS